MNGFPLWPSTAGTVNSTKEAFVQNQFTAELMPLFIQHARLTDAAAALQDKVIALYLSAAVAAAENATLRDVRLRQREWVVLGAPRFEFRRGAWKDVVANPTGVVVGDTGPKSWGFSIDAPATDFGVTATTGYATLDEVPTDMVSFILSAAAWQYEMRELATYSSMIQHADVIPLYLLDPWTIPTYA